MLKIFSQLEYCHVFAMNRAKSQIFMLSTFVSVVFLNLGHVVMVPVPTNGIGTAPVLTQVLFLLMRYLNL